MRFIWLFRWGFLPFAWGYDYLGEVIRITHLLRQLPLDLSLRVGFLCFYLCSSSVLFYFVSSWQDCQKRFTEYSSLYKHTLVHSDIRPFICDRCPRSYRQLCTLNVHKKTNHRESKNKKPSNRVSNQLISIQSFLTSYYSFVHFSK